MLRKLLQHGQIALAVLAPAVALHPARDAVGQAQVVAAVAPDGGVELDVREGGVEGDVEVVEVAGEQDRELDEVVFGGGVVFWRAGHFGVGGEILVQAGYGGD